jgi:DNA-binding NarL/FixJ family response regulator
MITVAIIEDNRLVREGMTDMLNELPDVEVVHAATSLDTAVLKKASPRVVLLDIGLQDTNCLHVAETVRKEMANSEVIAMDLLPVHDVTRSWHDPRPDSITLTDNAAVFRCVLARNGAIIIGQQ